MFVRIPKNINIPKYNRIRKQMKDGPVSKFYKFVKKNTELSHKLEKNTVYPSSFN